jgi:hypothetical protein
MVKTDPLNVFYIMLWLTRAKPRHSTGPYCSTKPRLWHDLAYNDLNMKLHDICSAIFKYPTLWLLSTPKLKNPWRLMMWKQPTIMNLTEFISSETDFLKRFQQWQEWQGKCVGIKGGYLKIYYLLFRLSYVNSFKMPTKGLSHPYVAGVLHNPFIPFKNSLTL